MADVVAARYVRQRFTGLTAGDGFAPLVRRQLGRPAEQHPTGSRTLAAVTGARNDQVPLELGQPAKHRARMAALWEERRNLCAFLPPDPERLRVIDAQLMEIGKIVADALPVADLRAEVDLRIVD